MNNAPTASAMQDGDFTPIRFVCGCGKVVWKRAIEFKRLCQQHRKCSKCMMPEKVAEILDSHHALPPISRFLIEPKQEEAKRRAKLRRPNEAVDISKEWKMGELILPIKIVNRPLAK